MDDDKSMSNPFAVCIFNQSNGGLFISQAWSGQSIKPALVLQSRRSDNIDGVLSLAAAIVAGDD